MPNPNMPGGNFTACYGIMRRQGYTDEQARRICGSMEAADPGRAEPPAPASSATAATANFAAAEDAEQRPNAGGGSSSPPQ